MNNCKKMHNIIELQATTTSNLHGSLSNYSALVNLSAQEKESITLKVAL